MKGIKKILNDIILDLEREELSIKEIAEKYGVSKGTISNINNGKSHFNNNRKYPIRKARENRCINVYYKAFISHYNKHYNYKQLHIIISKFSYPTICDMARFVNKGDYGYNAELEERRKVFDIITTPNKKFLNSIDKITFEDAIYIKFLARFNTKIEDVIYIFLDIINRESEVYQMIPLQTKEDVIKYLSWGGKQSSILWFIQGIYYNTIKNINNQPIFFDDFDIEKHFKDVLTTKQLKIAKEMLDFHTQENYLRRTK